MALVEFVQRSSPDAQSNSALVFGQRKDQAHINTEHADVSVADRSQSPAAATTAFPLGPACPASLARSLIDAIVVTAAVRLLLQPRPRLFDAFVYIHGDDADTKNIAASRCCYGWSVKASYMIYTFKLYFLHAHDTGPHTVDEYSTLIVHAGCSDTLTINIKAWLYQSTSLTRVPQMTA